MDPYLQKEEQQRQEAAKKRQRRRQAAAAKRSSAARAKAAPNAGTRQSSASRSRQAAASSRQAAAPAKKRRSIQSTVQSAVQKERQTRAQLRRLREEQAGQQAQEERWSRSGIPMWGRTLIAVAVVVLLLLVFFRVDRFEVEGNVRYSVEEVADASGITIGDVLMGVNKTKAASRIIVGLPYVQQVVVHKVLPGTVRFSLVECKAMAAAQSEFGKVWLVNADGKLLESLDNSENIGYPLIQGPVLDLPTGGDPVTFDDPEAGELGMQTAAELTAAGVSDQITIIDVSDPASIKLSYQDRIEVQLGDGTDLQYRIQYMIGALEKLSGNAKGVLDLTFALGEQAVFHPLA